jgi:hypothetical protein
MELPHMDAPKIRLSRAENTVSHGKQAGVGKEKLRVIIPGFENDPRFYIAATRVPEVSSRAFKFFSAMSGFFSPAVTIRVFDETKRNWVHVQINLSSLSKRTGIDVNVLKEKLSALEKAGKTGVQLTEAFTTFAVAEMKAALTQKLKKPLDDYLKMHCKKINAYEWRLPDGRTINSAFVEHLNELASRRDNGHQMAFFPPDMNALVTHGQVYILPNPPANASKFELQNLCRPGMKCEFYYAYNDQNASQFFTEMPASAKGEAVYIPLQYGESASSTNSFKGTLYIGTPYVETAEDNIENRSDSEIRQAFEKGLTQTLQDLKDLREANPAMKLYFKMVRRPDDTWGLEVRSPSDAHYDDDPNLSVRSVAASWVQFILKDPGYASRGHRADPERFKKRLKELGYDKAQTETLIALFNDMIPEQRSSPALEVSTAMTRANSVFRTRS